MMIGLLRQFLMANSLRNTQNNKSHPNKLAVFVSWFSLSPFSSAGCGKVSLPRALAPGWNPPSRLPCPGQSTLAALSRNAPSLARTTRNTAAKDGAIRQMQ